MWQNTKQQSKTGLDKAWTWAGKIDGPASKFSFWASSLDKESTKAARILSSFCQEGFNKDASSSTGQPSNKKPKGKDYVLRKIPPDVIRNAVGLAIFSTLRAGFHASLASGSGVLLARKADGTWSPPSGILLHTVGVGFLIGVDIYDCVLVINTYEALDAFCKTRCTLGGEISAAAGPVGAGYSVESEVVLKRAAPVFTYVKSKGFYAGVQLDGTVIIERKEENKRFYGESVPVARILAGDVDEDLELDAVAPLWEAVKVAEGPNELKQEGTMGFPLMPDGTPVAEAAEPRPDPRRPSIN
ncbi:uncharacterized protein K452DRAFT_357546 [Aplosporella prunicola CBS 121167]|uniref:Ysc84 actin-binding domain-containing protein n=1 Tax=Aplosporella prunicola CBS 121167 TaxID=1176127 RepID=A0A6A6BIK8_9PEZI|nr:uncharacterized protein K452DRAFT_357546 [Aplosporella prunicola CBS 121167]KAF2143155.1 hypothetical protein K452DRAFT_357546 [Aplosporella prunicola CBS 121167]